MVKLQDIAAEAGVSVSTVSKVLNNYDGVNEETRKKVLAITRKLNYYPNAAARQIVTKRSKLLGILFSDSLDVGLEHPFYSKVIESFRTYVNEHDYDVIIMPSHRKEMSMSYLDHYYYRMLEGVFVCTYAGDDKDLNDLFSANVPVVTTDVIYKGVPLIVSNNTDACYDAYEYLYKRGHRDIVHLYGPQDTLAGKKRLEGFIQAEKIKNAQQDLCTKLAVNNFDFESGYKALNELLEKRDNILPDAIIACSDTVALGVIRALQDKNYNVPEDCSVIGFDNIEYTAYSSPTLSTMAQNSKKIGELAGETLLKQISGQKVQSKVLIPMQLIERGSTKPNF